MMLMGEAIPLSNDGPVLSVNEFDPMTPAEFVRICKHYGLSVQSWATFFGLNPRTMIRYQNGPGYTNGAEIPKSVALLLRTMVKSGLTPAEVHALRSVKTLT